MTIPSFRNTPTVKLNSGFQAPQSFFKPGISVTVTQTTDNQKLLSTITRGSDQRYDPYITQINIKQEGELGMLLRAEIQFTIERDSDFNTYSKYFLTPNKKVNLKINRASRWPAYAKNDPLEFKDLVIYDFAWTFNSIEQSYTCTTKMMGSNTLIEDVEAMVSFQDTAKAALGWEAKIIKIIVDTKGKERTRTVSVSTMSDYILWLANAKDKRVIKVLTKWRDGASNEQYVTLQFIVGLINDVIVPYHHKASVVGDIAQPKYELQKSIQIGAKTSEYFISPDPMSVIYTGTADNGTYDDKLKLTDAATTVDTSTGTINLTNIYISRTALINIESQAQQSADTVANSDKINESSRASTAMSISQFIQKLSALLNKNSGGLLDLVTYADEDPTTGVIHIVNRNSRGAKAKPLILNNRYPGDGVLIEADITAEVPKDQVSANAYANNLRGVAAQELDPDKEKSKIAAAKEERDEKFANATTQMISYRTTDLPTNEFDDETVTAAQSTLRSVIQNMSISAVKRHINSPYPLKLKLRLQGVAGFKFGDLVTLKHLPLQYKDTVCFRVVRVSHTIENNDWTTELETVCDLL